MSLPALISEGANMKLHFPIATLLIIAVMAVLPASGHAEAPTIRPRIISEYPHHTATYTQGLFYHDGIFYESSGGYVNSYLATVQPESGRILDAIPVPSQFFAEGIAPHGNTLHLLTWKSGVGFIHDLKTLQQVGSFRHDADTKTEGWGLTTDGTHFIRSSGTPDITFHDPDDFRLVKTISVHDGDRPIERLNELEFIKGRIVANIWQSDVLAIIEPRSGDVTGWVDLSSLRERIAPGSLSANGIAYDPATDRIFVTGKRWDKLFLIEIDGLSGQ